jgi:predicted permease
LSRASRFAAKLEGLFGQRRLDRELDDELRFHLEMQAEDNERAGMTPDEAWRAALRSFGGVEQAKLQYRERRAFVWMSSTAQDLRYALRGMRRSPAFAAAAVLSLALGIGANTAIFTLVDAVLLRSLPVRNPQQLVQLVVPQPNGESAQAFPYPLVRALAEHSEIFSGLAGFSSVTFDVGDPSAPMKTPGAWVTGAYYETLGVEPVAGRLLTRADDMPGAHPVAVITDGFWARRYARDPNVIGQTIRIDGGLASIVGVTSPGFDGVDVGHAAEITITGATLAQLQPDGLDAMQIRSNYMTLRIIARPSVALTRAKARLAAVFPPLVRDSPFSNRFAAPPDLIPAASGWTNLRDQFRLPLLVLMAVVALVLLIACCNVANLLLARAGARGREIAVRVAIGAGRSRVMRQLLTESALLAALGAALGTALAWFGCRFLVGLLSSGRRDPVVLDLAPLGHVFVFIILISAAAVLLFGTAPAFRATDPGHAPLQSGHSYLSGSRNRLAPVLVVAQVALSLPLLIGAGLFVATLQNLRHFNPGFRHDGVLIASRDTPGADFPGPRQFAVYRDLLDRIARTPGVVSASLSSSIVFPGGGVRYGISIPGSPAPPVNIDFERISPRYFETLRTPVLEGREFTFQDDETTQSAAIVNEAFARRFFADGHAIGRLLKIEGARAPARIVGMVKDERTESLREPGRPVVFVPLFQRREGFSAIFEVRASGSLRQIAADLRSEMQAVPGIKNVEVRPLTAEVERSLVQERLMATLAGSFGALALVLAVIGLYGLLAYAVTLRTREIGIRMALGARQGQTLWLVMRNALQLLFAGTLLGLPIAWAASRYVSSLLFGLTPADPTTTITAAIALIVCGLLAAMIPAVRASQVNPTTALRQD